MDPPDLTVPIGVEATCVSFNHLSQPRLLAFGGDVSLSVGALTDEKFERLVDIYHGP